MAVKTIQLPENLNPKEEELNNEDTKIIAAFRAVFDGYRRAQNRTRAIIKAYNDLESIALTLLKERQENRTESPKQMKQESPSMLGEEDELDVMLVDLTSDFDFERAETENLSLRSPSLLFGAHAKPTKNVKVLEDASTSKVEDIDVRPKQSTKLAVVNNQDRTSTENEKTDGNEQKFPLLGNTSVKNAFGGSAGESNSHSNPPKQRPKLSLNRTAYKIEKHKTPSGKPLKQSTLVFESPVVKMDISYSENIKPKPNVSHSPNLFDADYRANKTPNKKDSVVKEGNRDKDTLKLDEKKLDEPARSVSKVLGEQSAIKNDENADELANKFIVMETPSQIDESCRSLFADDDLEDFTVSEDLLNTCLDEPAVIDVAQLKTPKNGKRRKIDETIASPAQATQYFNNCDSIDETFFAPGEPHEKSKVDVKPVEKSMPRAGCSSFLTPKNAAEKSHAAKRKSVGVTAVNDELEDLNLVDSDWDSDISNDNWSTTPKRVLNNSYDIVPEKAKKSPNYAYVGKPERNKEKRSKLPGWDCWECEKYFSALNLPKAELQKRMKACSRHKAKYNPRYCTPKDFWNPDFPDTLDTSDWSDNEVKRG